MPRLSSRDSITASRSIGSQKLGHPVPDSYFVSDLNSGAPQPAQRYTPGSFDGLRGHASCLPGSDPAEAEPNVRENIDGCVGY
jgi:hypothetical protein